MPLIAQSQPRTPDDAARLLDGVRRSRYIARLTPDTFAHYAAAGTLRVYYTPAGDVCGFGAWEYVGADWVEIGPLYALTAYRGRGYGRLILRDVLAQTAGRHPYAATKNPAVKHLLVSSGFQRAGWRDLPPVVRRHIRHKLTLLRLLALLRHISFEPAALYWRP